MNKLSKLHEALNSEFRLACDAKMKSEFGIDTITEWNFFSGDVVTTRIDKKKFTTKQHSYLAGYSEGYAAAMNRVYKESVK